MVGASKGPRRLHPLASWKYLDGPLDGSGLAGGRSVLLLQRWDEQQALRLGAVVPSGRVKGTPRRQRPAAGHADADAGAGARAGVGVDRLQADLPVETRLKKKKVNTHTQSRFTFQTSSNHVAMFGIAQRINNAH